MADKVPAGVLVLKLIDDSVEVKLYFSECDNELPDLITELLPGTVILANVADSRIATLLKICDDGLEVRGREDIQEYFVPLYDVLTAAAANQVRLHPFVGVNDEENPDLERALESLRTLFEAAGRAKEGIEILCTVIGRMICSMMQREFYVSWA
jgi:hypothetical protein